MNKAILIGNVGRDPETKTTQNGTDVVNFSLATTDKYKDKKITEWHNIVAYNKIAQTITQYVHKGDKIMIEGKIQTRTWDDKDGTKHYKTEVVAWNCEFLGGNRPANTGPAAADGGDPPGREGEEEGGEEKLPF